MQCPLRIDEFEPAERLGIHVYQGRDESSAGVRNNEIYAAPPEDDLTKGLANRSRAGDVHDDSRDAACEPRLEILHQLVERVTRQVRHSDGTTAVEQFLADPGAD